MTNRVRTAFWVLFLAGVVPSAAAQPTPAQVDFFETKIRPIFADHCYECHSDQARKLKGGLRLDTASGFGKGGDSGPAVVPGDPETSLLIKAVRYQDKDLQMPPKDKKLVPERIADLEAWVKAGAPYPGDATNAHGASAIARARAEHWAFQPVRKPGLPQVKMKRWVQTPVDAFVLAKLEQKHLTPATPADRRTLIRRVSYDLLGLPPSPGEVEAFMNDRRPEAYAELVDRLLASPHYGERWGRHWLDVARYADTKGYLAGGEERRYAFSYTYRDYVVRSFNEDKPYNQFLTEQIAADCLPLGEDKSALGALGFLTLGRRFLNNQDDIIDDRIDVMTRGALGLTVACARCHDHKFDPIPTTDYYALHGVFASSEEPGEKPLLGPLRESNDYRDFLNQITNIQKEIAEFEDKEIAKFLTDLRQNVGDYLLAAREAAQLQDQSKFDTLAGDRKTLPAVLRRWMKELDTRRQGSDPIFSPWFDLSALAESDFAAQSGAIIAKATNSASVNVQVARALAEAQPVSLRKVADVYTQFFKDTDAAWKTALSAAEKENQPAPTALPDANREALRQVLFAEGAATNPPKDEVRKLHGRRLNEGAAPMRNRIEALNWTHPGAPPRAMAMADKPQPHNSHVARRGNPGNPGAEVPRRFLEILSASAPEPFTNGSGRLELARAIARPDNPLTARVYVNRVWLHHFGEGLVSTPGDFGIRTEAPVHRELLDYLASSFVEHDWSTKQLHRLILLSSTYQQSSQPEPRSLKADPDVRLLHHAKRRRLEFEELRDTLLAVSGKLDPKVGGLPVDIVTEPFSTRRTLYGLIDRQNLPGLFRTFDFANPDTSNQRRFETTVPQQALFMMNSPFVIEQARSLAQRAEVARAEGCEGKITTLYKLLWQRPPEAAELQHGEQFLATPPPGGGSLTPLEMYAQVLLLSNELMFVD